MISRATRGKELPRMIFIAIHLGVKPTRGGSPPRERRFSIRFVETIFELINRLLVIVDTRATYTIK